ncbi:MAG: nucleotidyltransferase [Hespellia sp.]|nr:nucleotidyltransferase [Hespellia sp.]
MKVVGLITEYNPFHRGHQYHIQQAKKITGADRVIVIMSGDFVQRGQPAIMPKHLRAKIALQCGASAVFELPVCYATGSAELFAVGAVSFLENLGIIDGICFGSECADIDILKKIARILADEPEDYLCVLKKKLQEGLSFPAARALALSNYCRDDHDADILEHPNNILGIEYLKALYRSKSRMTPYTIQRKGAAYHDSDIQDIYSSASSLRAFLREWNLSHSPFHNETPIASQIPESALSLLHEDYLKTFPVYTDTFSMVLKYALLLEQNFEQYQDVSPELSNRIVRLRNRYQSFEQFCDLLKTRELTHSRISRALLHIMLHITKSDTEHYLKNNIHFYARLLGFRTDETDVLTEIKLHSSLPLLTKLADTEGFSELAKQMLAMDCFASDLYCSAVTEIYRTPFTNEYQQQIVRV